MSAVHSGIHFQLYKNNTCQFFSPTVFFSMPVGAELPLYYTHKQGMNTILTFSLFIILPGLTAYLSK